MDKTHILNTPIVVRSLDPNKDSFRSREEDEETLGPEVPYLSAIEEYWNATIKRSQMMFALGGEINTQE